MQAVVKVCKYQINQQDAFWLQIPNCQTAYCKFEVVAGEDWQMLDGMDNGITQVARQSTGKDVSATCIRLSMFLESY